ncbi:hypothetical protein Pan216_31710 [Planctomycetes bacterium Pan216]|uniref:MG2 domain protein n=1 Tax=Kolteria novifilia TaxID=2527975 RepID=A0A518B5Q8_9BACT|nr:hypothetical protein Pan216_31710 [Planctomycetes bacterium Pan216]
MVALVAAALVLLVSSAGAQEQETEEAARLPLQWIYLPINQLGDFLPDDQVTRTLTKQEFDRLVKTFLERLAKSDSAVPVSADLRASFDPKTGRLVGEGMWTVPRTKAEQFIFGPWNLLVRSISARGESLTWGMKTDGELLIRSNAPLKEPIKIAWEVGPRLRRDDSWLFDLRIPSCAMSSLTLRLPKGWRLRANDERMMVDRVDGDWRLYCGGESWIRIELLPPRKKGERVVSSALTWTSDAVYTINPTGTRVSMEILFESLYQPVEQVTLLADQDLRIRDLRASIPAQWKRQKSADGSVRWVASFRRPPFGAFRVALDADLPTVTHARWSTPVVGVANALPRGSRLTYRVAPSLRMATVRTGTFRQQFARLNQDNYYVLSLLGPGGVMPIASAVELSDSDVVDGSRLAELLSNPNAKGNSRALDRIRSLLPASLRARLSKESKEPSLGAALLAAINQMIRRRDLDDGKAFVNLRSESGVASTQEAPSAGMVAWHGRQLLDAAFSGIIRPFHSSVPVLELVPTSADVDAQVRSLLEVGDQQETLTAEVTWRCLSGVLHQPSVSIPNGWEVTRITSETPQDLLSHRMETTPEGSVVTLVLTRGIPAGGSIRAWIEMAPVVPTPVSSEHEREIALPVARPQYVNPAHGNLYTIWFSPNLRFTTEGLPPDESSMVESASAKPLPEGSVYTFRYFTQLGEGRVRVERATTRLVATLTETVTYRSDAYDFVLEIDVESDGEDLRVVTLESNEALPEDVRWEVDGEPVAVEPRAPPRQSDPHVYVLTLTPSPRGRVAITARWEKSDSQASVPLIAVRDAGSFTGRVDVASALNRPIDVVAKGVSAKGQRKNTTSSHSMRGAQPFWSTTYSRLPVDARVELRPPGDPPAVDPTTPAGTVEMDCRSLLASDRAYHRVNLRLDVVRLGDLTLRLGREVTLWDIRLDGHSLVPDTSDEERLVVADLSPGVYQLELFVGGPLASRWGVWMPTLPLSVEGWTTTTARWEVATEEIARVWESRGLAAYTEAPLDSVSLLGWRSHDTDLALPTAQKVHRFALLDPESVSAVRLALLPESLTKRLGRLAALVCGLVVLFVARLWSSSVCRVGLGMALTGTLVLSLLGSELGELAASLGWASSLAFAALIMLKHPVAKRWLVVGMVLVCFAIPRSPARAAEPGTASTSEPPGKVLVPFDPTDLQKDLDQVVVSEKLLRRLGEEGKNPKGSIVITKASYEGTREMTDRIKWTARLEVTSYGEDDQDSVAISLPFQEVQPLSVEVSPESPPAPMGLNAGLDVSVASQGRSTIVIRFLTPVGRSGITRSVDFDIPPAPANELKLTIDGEAIELLPETLPTDLRVKPANKAATIVGRFGPDRRIRLRWRSVDPDSAGPAKVDATALVLQDVAAHTRDLVAYYEYLVTEGSVDHLSISLPDDVVIRRVDADGLRDWRVVTDPDKTTQPGKLSSPGTRHLMIDLDAPTSGIIHVRLHGLVAALRSTVVDLSVPSPEGVNDFDGMLAVRVPPGWSVGDAQWNGTRRALVREFEEAWLLQESLARERSDNQSELGLGIDKAVSFQGVPGRGILRIRTPRASWSVEQTVTLEPEPRLGIMRVGALLRLKVTSGKMFQAKMRLPKGFTVSRVVGKGLHHWSVKDRVLTVRSEDGLDSSEDGSSADWDLRVEGRRRLVASGEDGERRFSSLVSDFDWIGADQVSSTWRLAPPSGWVMTVATPVDAVIEEGPDDLPMVKSDGPNPSFTVMLVATPPRLTVENTTVVALTDESLSIRGSINLDILQGALREIGFSVPESIARLIRWDASSLKLVKSPRSGDGGIALFRASPPIQSPVTLHWQATVEFQPPFRFKIPRVTPVGRLAEKDRLIIANDSALRLSLEETEGLTPVPSTDRKFLADAQLSDKAELLSYRASDDDWKLELSLAPPDQALSYRAWQTDVDLVDDPLGRARGGSRWQLLGQSHGHVDIELDKPLQAERLLLDGQSIPYERTEKGIRFPVFPDSRWREVVLTWTMPSLTDRARLPWLVGAQEHDVLVRIDRRSATPEKSSDMSLARLSWLSKKAERGLEQARDRLDAVSANPTSENWRAFEREMMLSARAEVELRETLTDWDTDHSGAADGKLPVAFRDTRKTMRSLQRRFSQLQREAETLPGYRTVAPRAGANALLRGAPELDSRSNDTLLELPGPLAEIPIASSRSVLTSVGRADKRMLHAGTALVGLLLVLASGLKWRVRLYWPALTAGLGVAWLVVGRVELVGVLLLALSLIAAWLTVRGWFRPAIIGEDLCDSTIAQLSRSRFMEIAAE